MVENKTKLFSKGFTNIRSCKTRGKIVLKKIRSRLQNILNKNENKY